MDSDKNFKINKFQDFLFSNIVHFYFEIFSVYILAIKKLDFGKK